MSREIPRPWTPGPWTVGKGSDAYEHAINALTWGELATVYGRDPDADMPDGRWNAEGKANAALIAASPELFDALDRLHCWATKNGAPPELLAAALLVIRKVEGP